MTRPPLCRELVGRLVVLRRAVETNGGEQFRAGELMRVAHTWRGGFWLDAAISRRDVGHAENVRYRRTIRVRGRDDFRVVGA